MGLDISLHTYFAIETPLSTFFLDSGERVLACTRDTSHEVIDGAKFCQHCGGPTAQQIITTPTESFQAFCDQQGANPREAFELLRNESWEWSDAGGVKYTLGWYCVQAVDYHDLLDTERIWALGVKLQCFDIGLRGGPASGRLFTYTVNDFETLTKALLEVAADFKIEGTPKLYIQSYASY